eukprot:6413657-Amphidinium_carterae.2
MKGIWRAGKWMTGVGCAGGVRLRGLVSVLEQEHCILLRYFAGREHLLDVLVNGLRDGVIGYEIVAPSHGLDGLRFIWLGLLHEEPLYRPCDMQARMLGCGIMSLQVPEEDACSRVRELYRLIVRDGGLAVTVDLCVDWEGRQLGGDGVEDADRCV